MGQQLQGLGLLDQVSWLREARQTCGPLRGQERGKGRGQQVGGGAGEAGGRGRGARGRGTPAAAEAVGKAEKVEESRFLSY